MVHFTERVRFTLAGAVCNRTFSGGPGPCGCKPHLRKRGFVNQIVNHPALENENARCHRQRAEDLDHDIRRSEAAAAPTFDCKCTIAYPPPTQGVCMKSQINRRENVYQELGCQFAPGTWMSRCAPGWRRGRAGWAGAGWQINYHPRLTCDKLTNENVTIQAGSLHGKIRVLCEIRGFCSGLVVEFRNGMHSYGHS